VCILEYQILSGGYSSWLRPLTFSWQKLFIQMEDKVTKFYALEYLIEACLKVQETHMTHGDTHEDENEW